MVFGALKEAIRRHKTGSVDVELGQKMRFLPVFLLAALVALTGAKFPHKPPKGYATRNGRNFEIDGKPFVSPVSEAFVEKV
jgi:hypothetical protein